MPAALDEGMLAPTRLSGQVFSRCGSVVGKTPSVHDPKTVLARDHQVSSMIVAPGIHHDHDKFPPIFPKVSIRQTKFT